MCVMGLLTSAGCGTTCSRLNGPAAKFRSRFLRRSDLTRRLAIVKSHVRSDLKLREIEPRLLQQKCDTRRRAHLGGEVGWGPDDGPSERLFPDNSGIAEVAQLDLFGQ